MVCELEGAFDEDGGDVDLTGAAGASEPDGGVPDGVVTAAVALSEAEAVLSGLFVWADPWWVPDDEVEAAGANDLGEVETEGKAGACIGG